MDAIRRLAGRSAVAHGDLESQLRSRPVDEWRDAWREATDPTGRVEEFYALCREHFAVDCGRTVTVGGHATGMYPLILRGHHAPARADLVESALCVLRDAAVSPIGRWTLLRSP